MRYDIYDTIQNNGLKAEIVHDDSAESPRTFAEPLWNLVSNYRRISLDEGELTLEELMENRKRLERDYLIVPVYMYIHSGIALSLAPFSCPWDSGLGFVAYVSKADLRKEYNVKRLTPAVKQRAMDCLGSEVEEYGAYLNGNTFGVVVTDMESGEETDDTCWGFYGSESATDYANQVLCVDKPTKAA